MMRIDARSECVLLRNNERETVYVLVIAEILSRREPVKGNFSKENKICVRGNRINVATRSNYRVPKSSDRVRGKGCNGKSRGLERVLGQSTASSEFFEDNVRNVIHLYLDF